jgi:flavodoxin
MKALVVFESMFGNTQAVANAIAEGISPEMSVDVVEVSDAPSMIGDDIVLLAVGGPTHAFGMSRPSSRKSAATQASRGLVSTGDGVREWLGGLSKGHADVAAVAFDTRSARPGWVRFMGTAGSSINKRLKKLGFRMAAAPEHFLVDGTEGPLLDGELERARQWGKTLAAAAEPAKQPVS